MSVWTIKIVCRTKVPTVKMKLNWSREGRRAFKILFTFDFKILIYSAESSQNELARFSDILHSKSKENFVFHAPLRKPIFSRFH